MPYRFRLISNSFFLFELFRARSFSCPRFMNNSVTFWIISRLCISSSTKMIVVRSSYKLCRSFFQDLNNLTWGAVAATLAASLNCPFEKRRLNLRTKSSSAPGRSQRTASLRAKSGFCRLFVTNGMMLDSSIDTDSTCNSVACDSFIRQKKRIWECCAI